MTEAGALEGRTVLVTGASGFLGGHLCEELRRVGCTVLAPSSREVDLRDPRSLDRFADLTLYRIYHLAAWTQAGDFCKYHQSEQWLINQQINTSILTFWMNHHQNTKFISMGTSCAYEEGDDLHESKYLDGKPIDDLYVYAMTKRMLHIGAMAARRQFGAKYLTLVPSTLYGPGYHTGEKQMHFIFDLLYKILSYKYRGSPIVLWGDGYQRRELVYVKDFVRAMLALDDVAENEVVNIGAGEDYSIREFATMICEIAGVDPAALQFDTARYVGARKKILSTTRIEELLPGRPVTAIRSGLRETLEWMERKHFAET